MYGVDMKLLQNKDPEKGCELGAAQQMVVKLSESLHQHHADQANTSYSSLCLFCCSFMVDHSFSRLKTAGNVPQWLCQAA